MRDELPDYELKKLTFLTLIASFWTNPLKNRDFGFAWWSRFLIILAPMMFTTYRLLYMQDHLGMGVEEATAAVAHFYIAEIIMGFAYGIYMAVDQALVIDVLPNADRPGKDLGVINIANALPQPFAPALGGLFLGIGVPDSSNYTLMLWASGIVCVLGALVVLPIKRVR